MEPSKRELLRIIKTLSDSHSVRMGATNVTKKESAVVDIAACEITNRIAQIASFWLRIRFLVEPSSLYSQGVY